MNYIPPQTGQGPLLSYATPAAAEPYISLISTSERVNGLPKGLLARLIQQESYFNPNAVSPVGAQGIAQIMPATAKNAGYGMPVLKDPFDWKTAIPWAALYLKAMRNTTGGWDTALAAYNYGAGNVKRAVAAHGDNWLSVMPAETYNYVTKIGRDIPEVFA